MHNFKLASQGDQSPAASDLCHGGRPVLLICTSLSGLSDMSEGRVGQLCCKYAEGIVSCANGSFQSHSHLLKEGNGGHQADNSGGEGSGWRQSPEPQGKI